MSTTKKFLDESGVSLLWSKVKESDSALESQIKSMQADVNIVKVFGDVIESVQQAIPHLEEQVNTLKADDETEGSVDYKIAVYDTNLQEQLKDKADYTQLEEHTIQANARMDNAESAIQTTNDSIAKVNSTIVILTGDKTTVGSIDNKIAVAINENLRDFDSEGIQKELDSHNNRIEIIEDVLNGEGEGSVKSQIKNAVEVVSTDISNETSRATQVETELSGRITALENKEPESVEPFDPTNLQQQIDTNATNIGTNTSNINSILSDIEVLNGDVDVEGSVKKTVADEISKIVDSAPGTFDTFKEVAEWIASDETKTTEIVNTLASHDISIENLNSDISNETSRATQAETELSGRITALENKEPESVEPFDPTNLQQQIDTNATNIGTNTSNINSILSDIETINGDADIEGSIKRQIKNAVDGLIDGASDEYNSLNKIASKVSDIDNINISISTINASVKSNTDKLATLNGSVEDTDSIKYQIKNAIDAIIDNAPEDSNTLNKLATKLSGAESLSDRLTIVENWVGFGEDDDAGVITFEDIDNLSLQENE